MGFRGGMHEPTLRRSFYDPSLVPGGSGAVPGGAMEVVASSGTLRALAWVICPVGTPPRLPPASTRREATERAEMLLPRELRREASRALPGRTLPGDARDLLVNTIASSTGVTLPSVNADDPTIDERAVGGLIHIGMSPRVEALLRGIWRGIAPEFRESSGARLGDPRAGLDSDGFAMTLLDDGRARHLIVLGGSDYGTYYGVVGLLRQALDARWLHPGPDGAVVPHVDALTLHGPLNFYDEPDFRSRSLDALSGPVKTALPEVDAVRTWAMNNRMNPSDERVYIREAQAAVADVHCTAPELAWARVQYGKESRVPSSHALHDLLSPWEPSHSFPDTRIGDRHPDFYPDLRPRVSYGGDRFDVRGPGLAPLAQGLDPAMGVPLGGADLDIRFLPRNRLPSPPVDPDVPEDVSNCAPPGKAIGSRYDRWDRADKPPQMLRSIEIVSPSTPSGDARRAADMFGYGPSGNSTLTQLYCGHFCAIAGAGSLRFIPWTLRSTRTAVHDPDPTDWKPCVYGAQPVAPDRVPAPNPQLVSFLAIMVNRSAVTASVAGLRDEVCISIAPGDGYGWCQCDACAMSGTSSGNGAGGNLGGPDNAQVRLYAGRPLFRVAPDDPTVVPGSPARRSVVQEGALRSWRGSIEPTPPSADRAALAGYLPTWSCPDHFSRRVIDLTRAVSRVSWSGVYPQMYLSTLAYSQWRGAPMTPDLRELPADDGPDPSLAAYAGDQVVVFVTSTADLTEYTDGTFHEGLAPSELQYRYPRQFNAMRWSVLTRQHGVYEYMYGASFYAVPRVYSASLRRALQNAHRRRARAFNAETAPSWGAEGPKWFELGEMLWNITDQRHPAAPSSRRSPPMGVRASAFWYALDDRGRVVDGVMTALARVFDTLEARWVAAVSAAERANRRLESDETGQPKLLGAFLPAQLDAFDGFTPETLRWPRGLLDPCDVIGDLEAAVTAARAAGSSATAVLRRVELILAGMEPCAVLTRASRPIRVLHRWVQEHPITRIASLRPLPREGEAEFTQFLEALRIVDGWVAEPTRFTNEVHRALQASLLSRGLIARGDGQSLRLADPTEDEPFSWRLIAVHRPSLQQYVAEWNRAVGGRASPSMPINAEAFAPVGTIASMIVRVRTRRITT